METVVIFANSVKHGKHCVAGKRLDSGQWVRPVSDVTGRELDHERAKCRNPYGRFLVKPLQKIRMDLGDNVPLPHQPENYLTTDRDWLQHYTIASQELKTFQDNPRSLWGYGCAINAQSVASGSVSIRQSLYLISASNVILYRKENNKRRVKFSYNGTKYDFPVTDPFFEELSSGKKENNGFICVSLGEEFNELHYKIAAAIL